MSDDEVRISDLGLASFLTAKGHKPLRAEGPSGRREVIFRGVPADVIRDYYGGGDSVSARLLNDARREVRILIGGSK